MPDDVTYGETESAISVGGAVSGSCSTSKVRGLAVQIAREVDCTWPSSLVKFNQTSNIKFTSSAVLPFLHGSAKKDLAAAAAKRSLRVNSGYRTLPQQYLLYRWWRSGRCGIAAAALPGSSNHESGRAVDLANWSTRVGVMANHHWAHSVPGDPVHFDHFSSPDLRGRDVRAFQRLWNRNHPGDKIAVDGQYGPQTAARLRRAPAKGFKKGPQCASSIAVPDEGVLDVLAIEGNDIVAPGAPVLYVASVANSSATTWPASARLVIADGGASPLYDAATWDSPTQLRTLGVDVPAGGEIDLDVTVIAPMVNEDTPITLAVAIDDGPNRLGMFEIAFTATASGNADISAEDGGDEYDGTPADEDGVVEETGGCSTSRDTSLFAALALVLFVRRRRVRR